MKLKRSWLIVILGGGLPLAFALAALAQQPPIPHPKKAGTVSYQDCVACHATGKDGVTLWPDDHVGRTNDDCTGCHTELLPSKITHPADGWGDCLACHDSLRGAAAEIPSLDDAIYKHAAPENDGCLDCHVPSVPRSYEGMPPGACAVCHTEYPVDGTEKSQGARSFPHDLAAIQEREEGCLSCHDADALPLQAADGQIEHVSGQPYELAAHSASSALHDGVECAACHAREADVERDPSGRIRANVLVNPSAIGWVSTEVDCARCHQPGNVVAAPAAVLPPRGVLCLACHDATPTVRDALSGTGLAAFGVGMAVVVSIWARGSVGRRKGLSQGAHPLGFAFAFLRAFILDGLLHRRLFRAHKLRWFAHVCMFGGLASRCALGVWTWAMTALAPGSALTQTLVDRDAPWVALLYDSLGLVVLLGAILAIVRRWVSKDEQAVTGKPDVAAIAFLAGTFVLGFVVEGARILNAGLEAERAAFSFVGYVVSLLLGRLQVDWTNVYGWLWYGHAGLVALWAAYLPFSKFLHVLVGPFVAALNVAQKEIHCDE